MLDITRLEREEPYDLDEKIYFNAFTDTHKPWEQAKCRFVQEMQDVGMYIKTAMYSPMLEESTSHYFGDLYFTGNTEANWPSYIDRVKELTQRWRYLGIGKCVLYLYQTSLVANPTDPTLPLRHFIHFVVTPVPHLFDVCDNATQKYLGA